MKIICRALGAAVLALAMALVANPAPASANASETPWSGPDVSIRSQLDDPDWPVQEAAEAWDDSSYLDITYTGTSCTKVYACITVKWGPLPDTTLGYTTRAKDGMGRYKACTIVINDRMLPSFDDRRKLQLLRHEVGHCFGFNHSRTGQDVMYGLIQVGGPLNLSDFHKTRLCEVYGGSLCGQP